MVHSPPFNRTMGRLVTGKLFQEVARQDMKGIKKKQVATEIAKVISNAPRDERRVRGKIPGYTDLDKEI